MQTIQFGNLRVQLLTSELVRIEYGRGGRFCDVPTFHIPDRTQFDATDIPYALEENVLCFGDYELYLPEHARSLRGVRLEKRGKLVYAYRKLKNSGQLPRPDKTPEVFTLADNPRILVPEHGYAVPRGRKTSGFKVQENVQDVYLLLCGGDAAKLRRLYVTLTGRSELVRLATLGSWNSKYYAYTEETAKQVILDYQAHQVPLDNLVIDTDWRISTGRGIGYDINTELFPDMARFLSFAHSQNIEVTFNDHPEPQPGAASLFDAGEIRFREEKLQNLLKLGLDTWWYDRNWITRLVSPTRDIPPDTLGMYAFQDITRHFYQKQAGSREVYRRPVIMCNADQVHHGRFWSISNSASHRYSIHWTGDTYSDADSLAREVQNLVLCGEQCLPYINADCGGHLGDPDKELFIRWMQFGVLSPIFRPHCANFCKPFREPWLYDEQTLDIVREANLLRYRLLPVLYSLARRSYDTGMPIFRSLALAFPGDKKAAACRDQYLLGENLLIAPIVGNLDKPLPSTAYQTPVKAVFYAGTELQGEPLLTREYKTLALAEHWKALEPELPEKNLSARFETTVRLSADRELYLLVDDGATVWVNGQQVAQDSAFWSAVKLPLGLCRAGEDYHLVVEYVQTGSEMICALCAEPEARPAGRAVYLPAGQWMDVYTGRIYEGGKTVRREYGLEEFPVFVRLGAVLPLAYAAANTREQTWQKLVYDCYPAPAGDRGVLYEDDGDTTAYQLGEYRTSGYALTCRPEERAYALTLDGAEGSFSGPRACAKREITVKFHCLKTVGAVERVTVNGEDVPFRLEKKRRSALPIHTDGAARDSAVALVSFSAPVSEKQEILFYLKETSQNNRR